MSFLLNSRQKKILIAIAGACIGPLQIHAAAYPDASAISLTKQHPEWVVSYLNIRQYDHYDYKRDDYKRVNRPGVARYFEKNSSVGLLQSGSQEDQIYVLGDQNRLFKSDLYELKQRLVLGLDMSEADKDRLFEAGGMLEPIYAVTDDSIEGLGQEKQFFCDIPKVVMSRESKRFVLYTDADTYIARSGCSRFAGFLITGMRKEISGERRVRSCMLYVCDRFRARGYARKLFNHMLQDLKAKGQSDISFCVEKTDPSCTLWNGKLQDFDREDFSETEYIYRLKN